jgi:cytidylate kinase
VTDSKAASSELNVTGLSRKGLCYNKVIAIDGPAASGKSTAAQRVARRLNFVHVNSGLFFRAITWWALKNALDEATGAFSEALGDLDINLERFQNELTVIVDDVTPGEALHGPVVTERVSAISQLPVVRSMVLEHLRYAASQFDVVCDGRDIGTSVFRQANLKVYLVADVLERARRRLAEGQHDVNQEGLKGEQARLTARDRADASRAHSPLRKARDAIEIDTTRMNLDEVVEVILSLARERKLG